MNFLISEIYLAQDTSLQSPQLWAPTYRPSYLLALLESPREDVEELGGSERSKRNTHRIPKGGSHDIGIHQSKIWGLPSEQYTYPTKREVGKNHHSSWILNSLECSNIFGAPLEFWQEKHIMVDFFLKVHSFHDTFNCPFFFRAKRNLGRCPMFHFFESRGRWSLAVSSGAKNLRLLKSCESI